MRRGDSANFWILQEMTKRLKGFVSDTGIKPFLWFDEKTAQLPSMLGDCYAIHHQIYLLARRLSFNPGTGAVVENIKWSTRAPPIKIGEIYWSARRSSKCFISANSKSKLWHSPRIKNTLLQIKSAFLSGPSGHIDLIFCFVGASPRLNDCFHHIEPPGNKGQLR